MKRARGLAAGLLSTVLVLLTAAPAAAHTDLEDSTPGAEAQVATAKSVRLVFDEPAQLAGTGLQVRDPHGELVASRVSSPMGAQIDLGLPGDLAKGVYTVGWVVRSEDSDIVSGSYQFTVTAGAQDGSGTSPTVLVVGAVLVVAAAGVLVGLRRRSRVAALAGVLVLIAGGLFLVAHGSRSDAWDVEVEADPAEVGPNTVTVTVPDDGPADQIDVRVVLDRTHTVVDVPVVAAGDGTYRARDVNLPLAGDWRASVVVRRGDQQQLLGGTFAVAER